MASGYSSVLEHLSNMSGGGVHWQMVGDLSLHCLSVAILIKTQRQNFGAQPEGQKSKAKRFLLLTSTSVQSCLKESQNETVSSHFTFLSRAGIKSVYHHCLVWKVGHCSCFTFWTKKLYLLKYTRNITTVVSSNSWLGLLIICALLRSRCQ